MRPSLLPTTLLAATTLAAPYARIKNDLILGSTSNSVDTFLGIPYADPPVGNLRLRRPQPLSKPLGTFNATTLPKACSQKPATGDLPILESFPKEVKEIYTSYNAPYPSTGEDCLTINVQRPANTTADAKLPVLFWIYGGAWEDGAHWYMTGLREPIIVVEANYRLNTFGFLGGKEVKADGIANLGLRDQRLALEWVQENIKAFGGDPDKVTLMGQSAGSVSVGYHLLINGGNHKSASTGKPLFRAGIMHSGTAFPADAVDSIQAQATYDLIVYEAGCKASKATLECLRKAPYEKLVEATNKISLLYSPAGFYMNYLPRPDSSDNFFTTSEVSRGSGIADVPLIVGHQEDEGTTFMAVTSDISNNTALVTVLQKNFPRASRPSLEKFVAYYKGDELTGAPFRTNASQNAYSNSKINSAVLTDLVFVFPIRHFLQSITGASAITKYKSPVWSFQGSYMYGFPLLGSFHGSDTVLFAIKQPANVFDSIVSRYVRFVRTGVPDSDKGEKWPTYGAKEELLQINVDGEKVIKGDFRPTAYGYFQKAKGMWKF
ncbi:lipase 4 [Phaeosphaeriaceae sp. PMI808]|nr:lipase 4 [Phaeosphaeriaceae sp. PMI808]